ncbi:hypothetical protein EYW49_15170 [Siculibacillus lacustris]|uniref:Uncharacterized protein n=1 Tax=Siculibacillus lacustris TaxID=1549641 RepID=A0A4Q9VLR5_9HYPH|nr:hypothetical protein [Siculibacillus lacustris]TBW35955.1 hypothetical protein EYW49_15170 [Siculibacillus lacustris]
MADYHAILKRAISSLPSPTGEARRAVYEKARTALVNQLKSFDPPLGASEITQQRLQLEDAIRKVESEAAKGLLRAKPAAPADLPVAAPAPVEAAPPPAAAPHPVDPAPGAPFVASPPPGVPLKKVATAADAGTAAEAGRQNRELLTVAEPPPTAFARETTAVKPGRPAKRARRRDPMVGAGLKARLPVIIGVLVAILVIGVGVVALWSQREAISAFFGSAKAPAVDLAARSAGDKLIPKSTDRLGADDTGAKAATNGAKPVPTQIITPSPQLQAAGGDAVKPDPVPQQAVPLVAQSAILYEEGKAGGGQAQISPGKVVWQVQPDPTDPKPGAMLLKARVEIPDRNVVVLIQMHPNGDTSFPASHMVEIKFNLPPDFDGKSIGSVPGLIMKASEQARGDALTGAAAKVSDNFFWIALSATEADKQRNLKSLRERGWIDLPVLYESGRRAILTIEKGSAGERAVADALTAWGQGG